MLTANAVIRFTLIDKNYNVKPLRVAFNFGSGLLFTGEIVSDHAEYSYNETYGVAVDFFTVEDEAYAALEPILEPGMGVTMQAGSRILGTAELNNFTYAND
jgi:hypothetical protein